MPISIENGPRCWLQSTHFALIQRMHRHSEYNCSEEQSDDEYWCCVSMANWSTQFKHNIGYRLRRWPTSSDMGIGTPFGLHGSVLAASILVFLLPLIRCRSFVFAIQAISRRAWTHSAWTCWNIQNHAPVRILNLFHDYILSIEESSLSFLTAHSYVVCCEANICVMNINNNCVCELFRPELKQTTTYFDCGIPTRAYNSTICVIFKCVCVCVCGYKVVCVCTNLLYYNKWMGNWVTGWTHMGITGCSVFFLFVKNY